MVAICLKIGYNGIKSTKGDEMKQVLILLAALLIGLCGLAGAETLVIPGNVDAVEAEAFCGVKDVRLLIVEEGVTRLEARAFASSAIEEIALPETLTYISDDAFEDCDLFIVTAPEGSFAWEWAVRMGYMEKTAFSASGKKDFASFDAARAMVETACTVDWSGAGRVRYVEQFGSACTYVPQYWVSYSDASGSCTRAAGSMAASYMGINALPRAATDFTKFQTYIKNQGCTVSTNTACSLTTFVSWYDAYARDEAGNVSPVVIYTNYGTSKHAFVVIGRDANEHDCFYIADSGSSSYVNRIRLGEEKDKLYIAEYLFSSGKVDTRYGKEHPMIYFWHYEKN